MRCLIVFFLLCSLFPFPAALAKDGLELPIKKLYASPSLESEVVYEIPIEVKILDAVKDENYIWHKVKISFNLGPFCHSYAGWTPVPVNYMSKEPEVIGTLQSLPKAR